MKPADLVPILTAALDLLKGIETSILVERTKGTCYFHLASMESHLEEAKITQALVDSKRSIELLRKVVTVDPKVADLQLLGQAYLLQSSLEVDDDEMAIAAWDLGTIALQEALKIDPDNENL